MVKDKIAAQEGLWGRIESQAGDWWPDAEVNRLDGLKWIWKDRWIHLRASNTEPIIRILAEGPSEEAALGLVDAFKKRI
jgi:phosphomannomutase